jgi:hypothetical protein
MDRSERYRDEAAAALELSAFAKDEMGKMALLIIAKGWLNLANSVPDRHDPAKELIADLAGRQAERERRALDRPAM